MLKGKCTKCGAIYVGWALTSPRNQKCPQCGGDLVITSDGKPKPVVKDYLPREKP